MSVGGIGHFSSLPSPPESALDPAFGAQAWKLQMFLSVLGPGQTLQEGPGNMRSCAVSCVFSMFWGPGNYSTRALEA